MKQSLVIMTICAIPFAASAQSEGDFSLPELPYATDALEPIISATTMELHHGQSHENLPCPCAAPI